MKMFKDEDEARQYLKSLKEALNGVRWTSEGELYIEGTIRWWKDEGRIQNNIETKAG
jgi:hypothetical protein